MNIGIPIARTTVVVGLAVMTVTTLPKNEPMVGSIAGAAALSPSKVTKLILLPDVQEVL